MADKDLQPGILYWRLLEPLGDAISIYDGPKVFLEQFRKVPLETGLLFAAHCCQAEVCNGGFHQFFSNSTGVLAPEALQAFQGMSLEDWAGLLEEAMRFFGSPYPRDRNKRVALLSKASGSRREEWDPFNELDDRFYEWLHAEKDRWERAADAFARRITSAGQ